MALRLSAESMREYSGSWAPAIATLLAKIAIKAKAEAMRADSSSGSGQPTGRREVASAKTFNLPGRCTMSNFQRPVRCLRQNRRGLATESRGFEPRRDTRG